MSTPSNTSSRSLPPLPPVRAEYELTLQPVPPGGDSLPLPLARRLAEAGWLRRTLIALLLIGAWEITARIVNNDLLVPTFGATLEAFVQGILSGELLEKTAISLSVLLRGYAIGVVLAFALTALAVSTRVGRDLLSMLTAMFNPLPSMPCCPSPCCGSGSAPAVCFSCWFTRCSGRLR
jgi:NitT/TauT family transport system permease protein